MCAINDADTAAELSAKPHQRMHVLVCRAAACEADDEGLSASLTLMLSVISHLGIA